MDVFSDNVPNSISGRFAPAAPLDATVLSGIRAIYCSATGNLVVKGTDGVLATFTGVPTGALLYISPVNIMTATTGTYVLLY